MHLVSCVCVWPWRRVTAIVFGSITSTIVFKYHNINRRSSFRATFRDKRSKKNQSRKLYVNVESAVVPIGESRKITRQLFYFFSIRRDSSELREFFLSLIYAVLYYSFVRFEANVLVLKRFILTCIYISNSRVHRNEFRVILFRTAVTQRVEIRRWLNGRINEYAIILRRGIKIIILYRSLCT